MSDSPIDAFIVAAAPVFRENFRPDSCLNSTRVFIEVMKAFGVTARPLSVTAMALNRVFVELAGRRGSLPSEKECQEWVKLGGWALGIDTVGNRAQGIGWPGHLVAIVEDRLVDSSARQFSRPEKEIVIPDIFDGPIPPGFLEAKRSAVYENDHGAQLHYFVREGDTSYEKISGFRWHGGNKRIADQIVIEMARLLDVRVPTLPKEVAPDPADRAVAPVVPISLWMPGKSVKG